MHKSRDDPFLERALHPPPSPVVCPGGCKPVTHCLSLQHVDGKDEDHVDEDYRVDDDGDQD